MRVLNDLLFFVSDGMRIFISFAIVLSGGSYKTMIQIAILAFLEFIGVYPRAIYAISGGVPNAIGYMLKKAWCLPALWFAVNPEKFYSVGWWRLLFVPLLRRKRPAFGAQAILKDKLLREILDREVDYAALLRSPITLWIGALDLRTRRVVWFSNHDADMTPSRFRDIVHASMRIPIFFAPVSVDNMQLADAGQRTNLPIGRAIKDGYTKILALNALPKEFPAEPIPALETWPEIEVVNTDVAHLVEPERHRTGIPKVNTHLSCVKRIVEEVLPRISEEAGAKLMAIVDAMPYSKKLAVNLCLVDAPAGITIFKKEGSYGYPSPKARFEILGAGLGAIGKVHDFLVKSGMLSAMTEQAVKLFGIDFTLGAVKAWFAIEKPGVSYSEEELGAAINNISTTSYL